MGNSGVVAFAFGTPYTILANRRIAQIASQKARELDAPVYTQRDVLIQPGIEVQYAGEQPGKPPPTLRIARASVAWARQRSLRVLWIVAAKPHLWRVLRDVRRAVLELGVEIIIHACDEIEQYTEDSWFCRNSTQERVRSLKIWRRREKILELLPFSIYKLIAK